MDTAHPTTASMCQSWSSIDQLRMGVSEMKITAIGLDLAKSVFQVHGVDERGHVVVCKQLKRHQVLPFFANLQPCLIGMEACGGFHYWARAIEKLGHQVRAMAPQFVKPYVKANKNDRNDAEAICEAVQRPSMRFVPVKSVEQQGILQLHRSRKLLVGMRTGLTNHLRGLLAEFGIVMPQGAKELPKRLPEILEDGANELLGITRQMMMGVLEHYRELVQRIAEIERMIQRWHRDNEASKRLAEIPGVGPLTATAMVGMIGDARAFKNGRQLAAYLGLVPRQNSSGGKEKLLGISKRGDSYIRTLLVHGARAVIRSTQTRMAAGKVSKDEWLPRLLGRCHINEAAVAQANKTARIIWALLAHQRSYSPACHQMGAMA
jgi:transposase